MTTLTTAVTGLVKGRVQGVLFRSAAQTRARKLNLTGWVRNTAEGDVESLIAGNKLAIEFMKVWLGKGSTAASVQSVELQPCDDPQLDDFEVRD